jgi:hypothetical protein
MIKPKNITVKDMDGEEIELIISRLPATVGREIIAKYPLSAMPKVGDYATNEETMLKLMGYVQVIKGKDEIPLKTKALIDNHLHDAETLFKVEYEMLKYNTSFLGNVKASNLIDQIKTKLPNIAQSILTDSLKQLLKKK